MKKILFLFAILISSYRCLALTSPTSINIEKTLLSGDKLEINPWSDFKAENKSVTGNLLPYGDMLTWYIDGKKNDKSTFSVDTWKLTGNSHPWGTSTNYPYSYYKYTLATNETGTHIFSVTVRYLWLYTNSGGDKVTEVNSKTIKYTIRVPGDEAYAALSDDNATLTFYYDKNKEDRNGMDIGPFYETEDIGWYDRRDDIKTVKFDKSFDNYHDVSSTGIWFHSCKKLSQISNLQYLHTENVTDMGGMFLGCSSLTSINVSGFNTQNVTSMEGMFSGCSSLESIDVSNFNTSKVSEAYQMFFNCSNLQYLDVSNFDMSNVYGNGLFYMFYGCTNLRSINLSHFNIENARSLLGMFSRCSSLKSLDLSSFDTKNVENMGDMFNGCYNLKTIYVSGKWSTRFVTYSRGMFMECWNLIGGKGTEVGLSYDCTYARIDLGESAPGYFTDKLSIDEIASIDESTKITFESDYFSNKELCNVVIYPAYYNIKNTPDNSAGSYNTADKSLIINKITSEGDMEIVVASDLGSVDVTSKFTGMVIEVNGKGNLIISAQTFGNSMVAVKIGNDAVKSFVQSVKGDITVNYDVTEDTYIYVYATDESNSRQPRQML